MISATVDDADPGTRLARLVQRFPWAIIVAVTAGLVVVALPSLDLRLTSSGAELLPKGTHEWAKFIRPSELASYCRQADLDLQGTRGMEYKPLTRRYWLSDDTSVNYMIATRRAP